jgi:DNA polymerase III subunit alpha
MVRNAMSDRPFVHLHCHSHYSLLDGASRIPELVSRAKELGMNAIALTDHGNLYGAIELYGQCKSAGLNPIIGYEAYIAPGERSERSASRRGDAAYHLTLLARNRTGFKNLIKMASAAFLQGYHYVPRIDKELLEAHKDGIVCLSGCASGEFSELILKDQLDEATKLAQWFARVFGEHFYVEIQNNGLDIQRRCAEGAIDVAKRLGLPLVATSDAHYLCRDDSAAHDVLLCINTGKMRSDGNRMRYEGDQFYVRPPDEMYRLFPDHEDAVRRSQEIADGCHVDLDFKTRHFPVFDPPGGKTPEAYLRELCAEGVRFRYGDSPAPAVFDRLEHELGIICRMGFAGYFLIVSDFVRFAVEKGIPASARGSAVGSLVSYVLRLSHVDPLEYDLLFERFLDPNRSEAPDIDIDLCQEGREEVLAYVRQKYGEGSVAQIGTFGTLAARAAVKDVGRVLGFPIEQVNQLTKMIPERLDITLEDAVAESTDLRSLYESDPAVRELVDLARRLEGTNRNAGTHAAGVVIANGPLTDYVPLQRVVRKGDDAGARRDEAVVTTQWVMGDLEKVGLLKMDFLGLRTLTLIENAARLIEKTHGVRIDAYKLPKDDPETFAMLQRGDGKGVFQFESDGMRDLLKRMKPDHIRDLIACNALYRPGPLGGGMVDAYINCKHGRERPVYAHPVMEEILTETYGVMVYQEQVMRILNRLGGIELSSAYACIKAISKKKQDVIDERRIDFVRGAGERGVDDSTARDIFAKIVYFGGYGFNKSHTCAYAFISYQTAYLKVHFPAEFTAALLSSEVEDGNKRDVLVDHIADARRLGVTVLPPDVNASEADFGVRDGKVVFGLVAVKGVGRGAAVEIVRARDEGGPYKNVFDFCERVDPRIVSKMALEKLVKAGAFDGLGLHRAQALHVLPRALQSAADRQSDRRVGQGNLFDGFVAAEASANGVDEALPDVPAWSESDKLKYEKEVLDFYFSSHPLAQHEMELRRFSSHTIAELKGLEVDEEVTVGGMLTQLRFMNTKKARNGNTRYLRCKVEDFSGTAECVMWPDDFARYKDAIAEDTPCFVRGTVERNREEPGLVLTRIFTMVQAKRELATKLWLRLSLPQHGPRHIDQLADLLKRSQGRCPVFLAVRDPRGKTCVLQLARDLSINPASFPRDELEEILGPDGVRLE